MIILATKCDIAFEVKECMVEKFLKKSDKSSYKKAMDRLKSHRIK